MSFAELSWISILLVHDRVLHSEQCWALKSARRYGRSKLAKQGFLLPLLYSSAASTEALLHTGSVSHPLDHSQKRIPATFHRMESWHAASGWEQIVMNEASFQGGFHWGSLLLSTDTFSLDHWAVLFHRGPKKWKEHPARGMFLIWKLALWRGNYVLR